jgi:hypothetical protein
MAEIIAECALKRRFVFIPTILLSMVGSFAMRTR